MHSSYVSKLFKKNTGMNLSDYITSHRIKISKELLCDPQYKIYEVAYKVGFNGPKYFNKVFKSKTGMTPLEFKNRNIDNQYVK
jgi:two-component system response regulator YesN